MRLRERDGRLVLEEEDRPLSWLDYEERGETVHVESVHTAEGEEGKGYATELVDRAIPLLEERGDIQNSCPFVSYWAEKSGRDIPSTNLLRFEEAVREFNEYHEPEAEAEVEGYDEERIYLKMTGPACGSCGAYDYLEDVIADLDAVVESYEEVADGLRAVYRLEDGVY